MSDDLPVPRAPVSSTLLAGLPSTNCRVLRSIFSFWTSISFSASSDIAPHAYRLERAVAGTAAPVAPGDGGAPVGRRRQRLRQDGFDAGDELLGAFDQPFEFFVHDQER
jgi:hypothetical protein